jgi:hypothetical protein
MGININNSKNVTPIYYAGKLMLFWVEITKVNSSTVSSKHRYPENQNHHSVRKYKCNNSILADALY